MCWFSQRLTLLIICARPRVMILYLFIGSVVLPRAVTTHKSGPASVHLLTEQTCWRDGVESTMWHVYTKLDTNTGENSPVLLVACEVYRHINPLGKCILVSILSVLRVWIWKWNHEQSRFLNKFTRERRKKEAYGTLPGINNKYLNSKPTRRKFPAPFRAFHHPRRPPLLPLPLGSPVLAEDSNRQGMLALYMNMIFFR